MAKIDTKMGAPRKWKYEGTKKNVTVRLSEEEIRVIKNSFSSLQEFIQVCLEGLKTKTQKD